MDIESILKNHQFREMDAYFLRKNSSIFFSYLEDFLNEFYSFIFSFDHAKEFIHSNEIFDNHKVAISKWYLALFDGSYKKEYFLFLKNISDTHISIGLPSHYINAAIGFVRRFLRKAIIDEKKLFLLDPIDKLLDINLDILTTTYQEGDQVKLMKEVAFLREVSSKSLVTPFVQPICNAKTLKIEKHEALMRLQEPENPQELKSIFPYLETAKSIKIYRSLMRAMLEKTFYGFSNKNIPFSINLNYEDISDIHFVDEIFAHVLRDQNPSRVFFEIVETDFLKDISVVQSFTQKARKFGCKIAIDDFGSGFSSLENILLIKPEIIKIDGSLIKNIDSSLESELIVKNTINMAKDLGALTIAEFVHNESVMKKVQKLGADFLQGFHLGKPAPLSELKLDSLV